MAKGRGGGGGSSGRSSSRRRRDVVQWLRRTRRTTQEQAADAAVAQLAQDYRTVFAAEAGQRVLADLLARNHAGQSTSAPTPP